MENCAMHCDKCDYRIFEYARCCPNCGRTIESPTNAFAKTKAVPTRLDFWVANLRRSFSVPRLKRAA
jgi:hypothetical protein